jgi:hypothetical protein
MLRAGAPSNYSPRSIAGAFSLRWGGHQFCSWDGLGGGALNGVLQNGTFNGWPSWRCLTQGHVSVCQFLERPAASTSKTKKLNDPWACQMKGQITDLKRAHPDPDDRLAADLDQEVRTDEDRVKIHDRANAAYSIYARATASRRDNLRRSAEELRAHLAKAERALLELGGANFDTSFSEHSPVKSGIGNIGRNAPPAAKI